METPVWLDKATVKISLDARPLLASGEHPLERVIREASGLNPGEIFEIITPFVPVPMIEKIKQLGFDSFTSEETPGTFKTWFLKQ